MAALMHGDGRLRHPPRSWSERFGAPVAAGLVDGLTKLDKIPVLHQRKARPSRFPQDAAGLGPRRARRSRSSLADRLHNMRTTPDAMAAPHKRVRIAETAQDLCPSPGQARRGPPRASGPWPSGRKPGALGRPSHSRQSRRRLVLQVRSDTTGTPLGTRRPGPTSYPAARDDACLHRSAPKEHPEGFAQVQPTSSASASSCRSSDLLRSWRFCVALRPSPSQCMIQGLHRPKPNGYRSIHRP